MTQPHAYLGEESLTAHCLDCGKRWQAVGHKLCRKTRRAIDNHIAQHKHVVQLHHANARDERHT